RRLTGAPAPDSTGVAERQCMPRRPRRYVLAHSGRLRYNRLMREIFVAREHEISDGERKIIIDDKVEIGVFRVDGAFYAWRNDCPHQGGPVCQGRLMQGTEAAPLGIEPLLGALHQPTLANRAALVRAVVAPGVERAVDAKDTDLDLVVDDDLALAVGDLMLARNKDFPHESIVPEAPGARQNVAPRPPRHALPLGHACTIRSRRPCETSWSCTWPNRTVRTCRFSSRAAASAGW